MSERLRSTASRLAVPALLIAVLAVLAILAAPDGPEGPGLRDPEASPGAGAATRPDLRPVGGERARVAELLPSSGAHVADDDLSSGAGIDDPRLTIEVIDTLARPIEGARVSALSASGAHDLGSTGPGGLLALPWTDVPLNAQGALRLVVRHARHRPAEVPVDTRSSLVRVQLARGHTLLVQARSSLGGGLADATVESLLSMGVTQTDVVISSALTGAAGDCELTGLPPVKQLVRVSCPGFATRNVWAHVLETTTNRCQVTLEPAMSLAVHVLDEEGAVVPGARVTVAHGGAGPPPHGVADDAGLVLFDRLPPDADAIWMRVDAVGFERREATYDRQAWGGRDGLDVVLTRGATLRVTLDTSVAGCVPESLELVVHARPGGRAAPGLVAVADGTADEPLSVSGLPFETPLWAAIRRHDSVLVGVTDLLLRRGEIREVSLQLPPLVHVSVKVECDGRSLARGVVELRSSDGRPARPGAPSPHTGGRLAYWAPLAEARSMCIEPGTYDVIFRSAVHAGARPGVPLHEGGDVVLELTEAELEGTLLDGAGQPLAGEQLRVGTPVPQVATTDAQGRFHFSGPPTFAGVRLDLLDPQAGAVELRADLPAEGDIGAVVYERFVLRGTVRRLGQRRGLHAQVRFRRADQSLSARIWSLAQGASELDAVPVAPDGSFVASLPPGRWSVEAIAEGLTSLPLTVDVGAGLSERSVDCWVYRAARLILKAGDIAGDLSARLRVDTSQGPWEHVVSLGPDDVNGRSVPCPPGRATVRFLRKDDPVNTFSFDCDEGVVYAVTADESGV